MYKPEDMVLPESYRNTTETKNLPGLNPENNFNNYIAKTWSEEQAKAYLARYYGYVTYIDDQMSRVLDSLDTLGLTDDTIIVFSSDHGDMLCEQGMIYKHTFNGYDSLMKVPLMLQWPRAIGPQQVHEGLSSHVDLTPTLLELAGVEQSADMDGQSMAGVLTGKTESAREEVFADIHNEGFMIRLGNWKFVLNAALVGGRSVRRKDELYDLETDPAEMNNLAFDPKHAERIRRMKQRILVWLEASGYPYSEQIRQAAALPMPEV